MTPRIQVTAASASVSNSSDPSLQQQPSIVVVVV
jgi:hypothetical protein